MGGDTPAMNGASLFLVDNIWMDSSHQSSQDFRNDLPIKIPETDRPVLRKLKILMILRD